MDKNEEVIQLLKTYNQEHIINLLNKLDGKEKEELITIINNQNSSYFRNINIAKLRLNFQSAQFETNSYFEEADPQKPSPFTKLYIDKVILL